MVLKEKDFVINSNVLTLYIYMVEHNKDFGNALDIYDSFKKVKENKTNIVNLTENLENKSIVDSVKILINSDDKINFIREGNSNDKLAFLFFVTPMIALIESLSSCDFKSNDLFNITFDFINSVEII